jgi:hypothetical protein
MRVLLTCAVIVASGALAASARADDNDLVLARLAKPGPGGPIPDNQQFRSLTSELGVVFAPRNLAPADTLGFSGFQFSTEFSLTSISSDQSFWCATEESSSVVNGVNQSCAPGFKKSSTIPTFGVFARKGMWFPLPSFEVGAGAVHILSSRLWSAQAYAKFAIQEGYQGLPIPSVAVRGAASRLLGVDQLDLTDVSLDISVSKRFAVQGTFSLAPYVGYAFLWVIPRSQVVDFTPTVAVKDMPTDISNNFTFPDQDNIVRHRFFAGVKLKYYVFALTAEIDYAFAGSSVDDRAGTTMTCDAAPADQKNNCDATDKSSGQAAYSFSASLDF